jgi:hypothetical protein
MKKIMTRDLLASQMVLRHGITDNLTSVPLPFFLSSGMFRHKIISRRGLQAPEVLQRFTGLRIRGLPVFTQTKHPNSLLTKHLAN